MAMHTAGALELIRLCPACGGSSFTLAYPPTLCRCDCGLYFENPRPTESTIHSYYDSGLTFARFRRELEVRDRLWLKRLELVRHFTGSGRLLDVGTGDGRFLLHARRYFEVAGTEMSRTGIEIARTDGVEVHQGVVETLELPEGSFDVVTIWHVLEHVLWPAKTLAGVFQLLVPDGLLVVAVPNETRILDLQRLLHRSASPFFPLRAGDEIHLSHFTPEVLKSLLSRQGFRVLELRADDVDTERTLNSRSREFLRRLAGGVLARRWSTAMVAICRRSAEVEPR